MARYNTTVTSPDGKKQQGYIENGITYTNDGKRIGEGYSTVDAQGRTWVMQNGKGVLKNNAENAYIQKYTSGTYAGDKYIPTADFTVDMSKDYSELMKQNEGNPEAQKVIEEARNAKIAELKKAGITDYDETYNYADVNLGGQGIMDAYSKYEAQQKALQSQQSNSANANANAQIAQLDAYREQLGVEHTDELRDLWVESQLDQQALKEALAARGITGGNAETAELDLESAYQSNYANRVKNHNRQLAEVNKNIAGVQSNLADTLTAINNTYGSAVAEAYLEALERRAEAESARRAEIIAQLGL